MATGPASGGAPRPPAWLRARWSNERWTGRDLTVIVLVTAAFLGGFALIAWGIGASPTLAAWDEAVAATLRAARTPAATRLLWIATVTGDTRVEIAITGVFVLLLLLWGRRAEALLAIVTMAVGSMISGLLKVAAARPRPPVEYMLIRTPTTPSFPSGHAMSSAIFYGLLAFVLLRSADWRRWQRVTIVALCALAAFLVGVSRVYLGVHWPSDVLASWSLAGAVLTVSLGGFRTWERYSAPRPEPTPLWTRQTRRRITIIVTCFLVLAVAAGAQADPLLHSAVTGEPPPPGVSSPAAP